MSLRSRYHHFGVAIHFFGGGGVVVFSCLILVIVLFADVVVC